MATNEGSYGYTICCRAALSAPHAPSTFGFHAKANSMSNFVARMGSSISLSQTYSCWGLFNLPRTWNPDRIVAFVLHFNNISSVYVRSCSVQMCSQALVIKLLRTPPLDTVPWPDMTRAQQGLYFLLHILHFTDVSLNNWLNKATRADYWTSAH